jgi:hypothetical protein
MQSSGGHLNSCHLQITLGIFSGAKRVKNVFCAIALLADVS